MKCSTSSKIGNIDHIYAEKIWKTVRFIGNGIEVAVQLGSTLETEVGNANGDDSVFMNVEFLSMAKDKPNDIVHYCG
ncbi:hypothetical protein HYALB_00005593 [Hymenoscyphus albidus]|uniref:Uncharacterized protein n=1 Tax=Hymenoscyphus albidus TaxID=595503 RepID=A0A9N9LHH9_9HELO|nr:hypothetical protein HYALB_00005593 [Hymenoscyphus albidus]